MCICKAATALIASLLPLIFRKDYALNLSYSAASLRFSSSLKTLIQVAFLATLIAVHPSSPGRQMGQTCPYDKSAALGLDEEKFDSDPNYGWRTLSERKDCTNAAADLIDLYRNTKTVDQIHLSYWHEGQLRAELAQTEKALYLFEKAKLQNNTKPPLIEIFAWNLYVSATIAFVRGDGRELNKYRDMMLKLPAQQGPDGNDILPEKAWNVDVVEGLRNCLGQPYKVAYSLKCRAAKSSF
jgi:hypothetical protein